MSRLDYVKLKFDSLYSDTIKIANVHPNILQMYKNMLGLQYIL
jgi:hypothetical protein